MSHHNHLLVLEVVHVYVGIELHLEEQTVLLNARTVDNY